MAIKAKVTTRSFKADIDAGQIAANTTTRNFKANVTTNNIKANVTTNDVKAKITTNKIVAKVVTNEVVISTLGRQGPTGKGVPAGGTTKQILAKVNGDDFNTEWRSTWYDLVTGWTVVPYLATYSGGDGEVWVYTYGSTVYYRFVPSTYDSTLDVFYTTFSDPVLSGVVATRGEPI